MKATKTAIVTGGAAGLGLATARKFVQNGITTIILERNEEALKQASAELGEKCVPVLFDLTEFDKLPGLIEKLAKEQGGIDVLVNNAGINMKKFMVDVTDEEFQRVININLTGVFVITREVAKVMIAQKSGSIINISSMASQYGIPQVMAYTASKSAIEGMTRAMSVEFSPYGIRVNCIAPGFIKTAMSSAALDSDAERKQKVLSRTPMGKLGVPEDIANAAYFFASDESTYVTGTVLPVDGGNSIGF